VYHLLYTNHERNPMCEYFALCDNSAEGMVPNPILGNVPCCQRCADRVGATLLFDPDNPNAALLPDPSPAWSNDIDNLVLMVRWMADDGRSAYEVADAVEKPWKFVDEFKFARHALESAS
jgi:hypothetical protein